VPLGHRVDPDTRGHVAALNNSPAALAFRNGRSPAGVPLPIKDRMFRAARELQQVQEARKRERAERLEV
jgi:hypothetical protein